MQLDMLDGRSSPRFCTRVCEESGHVGRLNERAPLGLMGHRVGDAQPLDELFVTRTSPAATTGPAKARAAQVAEGRAARNPPLQAPVLHACLRKLARDPAPHMGMQIKDGTKNLAGPILRVHGLQLGTHVAPASLCPLDPLLLRIASWPH